MSGDSQVGDLAGGVSTIYRRFKVKAKLPEGREITAGFQCVRWAARPPDGSKLRWLGFLLVNRSRGLTSFG